MNSPETPPQRQPACQKLRSKEMFYYSAGDEDDQYSSGIYWCLKTNEGFGPDGQPAGRTECCPGRSCYVG
jgi:hypothetical protein